MPRRRRCRGGCAASRSRSASCPPCRFSEARCFTSAAPETLRIRNHGLVVGGSPDAWLPAGLKPARRQRKRGRGGGRARWRPRGAAARGPIRCAFCLKFPSPLPLGPNDGPKHGAATGRAHLGLAAGWGRIPVTSRATTELNFRISRAAIASAVVYAAATAIIGRHVLASPASAIAADVGDPVLNAAILAWNARTVPWTDAWFNFPGFYPATDALTFSEHLLGVSVIAAPLEWV